MGKNTEGRYLQSFSHLTFSQNQGWPLSFSSPDTNSGCLEGMWGRILRPHLHLAGESAKIREMPAALSRVGETALVSAVRHYYDRISFGEGIIMEGNFRRIQIDLVSDSCAI